MSNKWKDKWFYYKVLAAILILGGLLASYLNYMIAKVWIRNVDYPFSYVLFQGQFLSYFTYQSNLIIGIWFFLAAWYHNKNNAFIESQNIRLAITAYISVTCLTYIMVLFPAFVASNKHFSVRGVLNGTYFHLITPALMIFYSIYNIDNKKWSKKYSFKKSFFTFLIYPICYVGFILARIALFFFDTTLADVPFKIVYPYAPILGDLSTKAAFNGKLSYFLLILAFFVIVLMLFILLYFFYFYFLRKVNLNRELKRKIKAKLEKKHNNKL